MSVINPATIYPRWMVQYMFSLKLDWTPHSVRHERVLHDNREILYEITVTCQYWRWVRLVITRIIIDAWYHDCMVWNSSSGTILLWCCVLTLCPGWFSRLVLSCILEVEVPACSVHQLKGISNKVSWKWKRYWSWSELCFILSHKEILTFRCEMETNSPAL